MFMLYSKYLKQKLCKVGAIIKMVVVASLLKYPTNINDVQMNNITYTLLDIEVNNFKNSDFLKKINRCRDFKEDEL